MPRSSTGRRQQKMVSASPANEDAVFVLKWMAENTGKRQFSPMLWRLARAGIEGGAGFGGVLPSDLSISEDELDRLLDNL